jgi:hypothetical protein
LVAFAAFFAFFAMGSSRRVDGTNATRGVLISDDNPCSTPQGPIPADSQPTASRSSRLSSCYPQVSLRRRWPRAAIADG